MNDIKIIYKDNDILVLDKPSGITVNNADTTKGQFTIQDYLQERFIFLNPTNDEHDFYKRAGIVHRIDKETSGILVVARNKESFENLQSQFKERKVNKTYIALVHGHVDSKEGEISVPVGRLPWNRKRFGVLVGGKEAETHYKVLKKYQKPFTLLELTPKTGRTHQIRVHLKYFNHPIFGDYLYAGRKTSRQDRKVLERFFLHAQKIIFYHPKTGKKIEFESPLPLELKKMLETVSD
ncbi:MAG: RluA family pseudouridine synthase [Patescibacteria group bacterium]